MYFGKFFVRRPQQGNDVDDRASTIDYTYVNHINVIK